MSEGLKLLGAIIDTGSINLLRDVDRSLFIDEEIPVYDFMSTHYRRYGEIPAIATVEEQCDITIPEAPEAPDYYVARVHDRRMYSIVRSKFEDLKGCLRSYDMEAARDVIDDLRSSTQIIHTASDIRNIKEAMRGALRIYDEAHLNPGMSGVPVGWPRYDRATGGLQPGDLVTYVARPGMGKCMAPETPVVKYDGRVVRIDSLKAGDLLMGPDSTPRTVLSTNTGREEMFEVRPARGETWRCNRSHILALVCGKDLDSVHTNGGKYFYSVHEYLALPSRVQRAMRLWRTGVDMPFVEPNIDPYFVGLWLGDGTVGYARISTVDREVVDYLERFAAGEGLSISQYEHRHGACPVYGVVGGKGEDNYVLDYVRNKCYDRSGKRVPDLLLRNSREVRLQVLAGLIDSDGYNYGTGYEITTEYYGLSEDIRYLARSCGFGSTCKVKLVDGIEYYRVTVYGRGLGEIPCLLPRKRAVREVDIETVNSSFSVASLGEGEYFGITLDKDHLYLLGDFTVTHNTYLLLRQALSAWRAGYSVLVVTMEMTIEQCARRCIALETGINPTYIRRGELSTQARNRIGDYVDNISRSGRFRIFAGGLKSKVSDVEMLVSEYKPDVLFIDGVYLMQPDTKRQMSKLEKVPEVFDALKKMTISQNIPVVVTTQFSRAAGKKGKEGSLETIAYTDAISTHSSLVVSINDADPPHDKDVKVLAFMKGREGESGLFRINYRFTPMDFTEVPVEIDEEGNEILPASETARRTNDVNWMEGS